MGINATKFMRDAAIKKTGHATGFFYLPNGVIVQPFFTNHKLSWGTWDALLYKKIG